MYFDAPIRLNSPSYIHESSHQLVHSGVEVKGACTEEIHGPAIESYELGHQTITALLSLNTHTTYSNNSAFKNPDPIRAQNS